MSVSVNRNWNIFKLHGHLQIIVSCVHLTSFNHDHFFRFVKENIAFLAWEISCFLSYDLKEKETHFTISNVI